MDPVNEGGAAITETEIIEEARRIFGYLRDEKLGFACSSSWISHLIDGTQIEGRVRRFRRPSIYVNHKRRRDLENA